MPPGHARAFHPSKPRPLRPPLVRLDRRYANDDDPRPRRSDSEHAAQYRSRVVLLAVLRLWPAIDIRRGDRPPGRARRHGCRERSLSDSRIERPLLDSGLLTMPHEAFDELIRVLSKGREIGVAARDLTYTKTR